MFKNKKLQAKIDSLTEQLKNNKESLKGYREGYFKLKIENEKLKKIENEKLKHIKQENEIMKKYYKLDTEPSLEVQAKVLADLRLHDIEYKRLEELIQQNNFMYLQSQYPFYYPIYR